MMTTGMFSTCGPHVEGLLIGTSKRAQQCSRRASKSKQWGKVSQCRIENTHILIAYAHEGTKWCTITNNAIKIQTDSFIKVTKLPLTSYIRIFKGLPATATCVWVFSSQIPGLPSLSCERQRSQQHHSNRRGMQASCAGNGKRTWSSVLGVSVALDG